MSNILLCKETVISPDLRMTLVFNYIYIYL